MRSHLLSSEKGLFLVSQQVRIITTHINYRGWYSSCFYIHVVVTYYSGSGVGLWSETAKARFLDAAPHIMHFGQNAS